MNEGIIALMHYNAAYPYGLTSSKFYSGQWCSQAERPRFPLRRCVHFLPGAGAPCQDGCHYRGTGNIQIEGPYPRRFKEKLEELSLRAKVEVSLP